MILRLVQARFTFFGLPITLAGALLSKQSPPLSLWLWIIVAFVSARFAGMAFNQVIDRDIDACNDRTSSRPVACGAISSLQAWMIGWGFLAVFLLACFMINPVVFFASPIAAFLLWLYSYTKRFTLFCHFVLGLIQACGPLYAYMAVAGELAWPPVFLGMALLASITANDIIYALQDLEFDLEHDIHSIPVAMGPAASLWLARFLHAFALLFLVWVPIPWPFVAILAALLLIHHLNPLPRFASTSTLFSIIVFMGVLWGVIF